MNEATTLERELRAVYGAYLYLYTHDLAAISTTARLLHAGDSALLARRVRDEMAELHGAVDGTHSHSGGRDDIVLEAYQTLYWLMVLAVAEEMDYDDIRPHDLLAAPAGTDDAVIGIHDWPRWEETAGGDRKAHALRDGFAIVGQECRRGGIDPTEAVRRDLAELRARPYLAPYWAAYDGDTP